MNISWFEVGLGFFAIGYLGLEGMCYSAGINHGTTTGVISIGAAIYGGVKGLYAWNQSWKKRDRKDG